jgi:hypothetical protein
LFPLVSKPVGVFAGWLGTSGRPLCGRLVEG